MDGTTVVPLSERWCLVDTRTEAWFLVVALLILSDGVARVVYVDKGIVRQADVSTARGPFRLAEYVPDEED
jgi:3-hydroxyacyl-CoA dehydrogenase